MTFRLGAKSEDNLIGVDERLVRCVRRAIVVTTVDFGVFEGLRDVERQRKLVADGVSRTMNSKHLTGHAVDLVPYIGGRLQWQMPACIQVAIAMREAATAFGVTLTWGACWDRRISELDPRQMDDEVEEYAARFRLHAKRHPLIDGPHFEVVDP